VALRNRLKPGSVVKMPNGGQYVICEQIGEGGLSLIYAAKTKCNNYPVIIKEFFPAEHAHRAEKTLRASDGTILEKKDRVYPDSDHSERFERCLCAFEQEGQLGSCARLNSFQIISFTDSGNGFAVLPRWSNNSCSFDDLVDNWRFSPPASNDPVFTDLGRIHFSLMAIGSLLAALSSVHGQGMLHLDISPSNVVWAGQTHSSPENGVAFLTDFGCSVYMEDKAYPAECVLSYSKKYAAPEYGLKNGRLTEATDIYSVGRLLMFLCMGHRTFCEHLTLEELVSGLHIQERCRELLLTIIQKATAENMLDRYQSASEMQDAIGELLSVIPAHPINPDNTTAFSLYSLKSMLEGSLDTRYSWAHELCDRRGFTTMIPDSIHQPVAKLAGGHFKDEESFLRTVLPEGIFSCLWAQISKETDMRFAINGVMSGNYPQEWKTEIGSKFVDSSYAIPDLFKHCRKLLGSENSFKDSISFLFQLPGPDISYFERCYTECGFEIKRATYKGLALLVLFALLGQGECGFEAFAQHSPSEICRLMQK